MQTGAIVLQLKRDLILFFMIDNLKLKILSILYNALCHAEIADIQLLALFCAILILEDRKVVFIALYVAGSPGSAESDLAVVSLLSRKDDLSSLFHCLVHCLEQAAYFLVRQSLNSLFFGLIEAIEIILAVG